MIDYDQAELAARRLLAELSGARPQRRCLALRLACGIAALEFALLLAGALYAL
jgi:hypothetical protein